MTDLLKQMGQDNLSLNQALQDAPPQVAPKAMPELNTLGLEKFQPHMSPNGFDTFISLMHWAVLVQNLSDGTPVEWSNETYAAMSAPFVGFGNPLQWESTFSSNISIIVHSHYLNWHGEGSEYRRKNPLPIKLIKEVAPLFANMNRGWEHSQAIRDLIHDHEAV